jgi:tripartite-type tricarboxylate transporter receptor subunit TctC
MALTDTAAQHYPARPVRVIIGYPAGSGNDVIGRLVLGEAGKNLGQQFIIDNRPGASGNIGAEIVARSVPDGYTLLNAPGSISATPSLLKQPTYDLLRDMEAVSIMASVPFILVVHPSLPVRSAKSLIDFAKARPDQLTFASSGAGGLPHLTGELFCIRAGLKMLHVPYKGTGQANLDVIRGQVSMIFTPAPSVMPHIQSGRLRALAITSTTRHASLPEVPTLDKAALPGFEAINWVGLFAPRGIPTDVITRLNTEINRVVQTTAMQKIFAGLGTEPMAGNPQQWSSYVRSEVAKWALVVKEARITLQ